MNQVTQIKPRHLAASGAMKLGLLIFLISKLMIPQSALATETVKAIHPEAEYGEIIVYRLRGGSRSELLTIAREEVAPLRRKRHIRLYAKPGLQRFTIMPTGGSISIKIEAGKTHYLKVVNEILDRRLELTGSSAAPIVGTTRKTPRFLEVDEDTALTELKKTKQVATQYKHYEDYYPGPPD